MGKNEIRDIVRREVSKYLDREFGDRDKFVSDLGMASDDLTALALELEGIFEVRIARAEYRQVTDVATYVELINETLERFGSSGIRKARSNP